LLTHVLNLGKVGSFQIEHEKEQPSMVKDSKMNFSLLLSRGQTFVSLLVSQKIGFWDQQKKLSLSTRTVRLMVLVWNRKKRKS